MFDAVRGRPYHAELAKLGCGVFLSGSGLARAAWERSSAPRAAIAEAGTFDAFLLALRPSRA